jgi:predicted phosphodiesterase
MTTMRRMTLLIALLVALGLPGGGLAQDGPAAPKTEAKVEKTEPKKDEAKKDDEPSLRFAVVGDTGTGDRWQILVAKQMLAEHDRSPYPFVVMLGDNIYGGTFRRIKEVFEYPYEKLLDRGVKFYATLGNHDQKSFKDQVGYDKFNMGGQAYYKFAPADDLVEFFTINSSPIVEKNDTSQFEWLDKALDASKARWKIVFFHHPPFSPGKRHGDNPILVERVVPILKKNKVRIVMTGHEHFFAKMRTVDGIDYLISGSGGKIHRGGLQPDERLEAGNDEIHHFVSVTLTKDAFTYTAIGSEGETIYQGTIPYEVK